MWKFIQKTKNQFNKLGPGFITGAADDDPSGIATYSIAGAQFGYKLSWLAVFLTPLMYAIQEMCGRVGMVSGMGLAGSLKKHYPPYILHFAITLLFVANTINIGANLGVMAYILQSIIGFPLIFWLIAVTILTVSLEIFVSYDKYSRYLKWAGLSLLVYGVTAILVPHNWVNLLRYTLFPHFEFSRDYILTIVGLLGTTISPYLFFWQTSQQIEEEIKKGNINEFDETPVTKVAEIAQMRKDTKIGMIFSNLIFFFIIITTAATLNANGITQIDSPYQAALALKPLAGGFAYLLFAFGIIGIGLQSVPILAGSVAYAIADTFGFKEGLAKKLTEAKAFYATICLATLIGVLFNLLKINAIRALYFSAIINGIVAVPLIFIIIRIADNEKVVGIHRTGRRGKILGWFTFFFMGIAVLFMLINLFIR